MSFVLWAAFAIAGFVAFPIVAHLLRRGRANEREFPGAALVPPLTSTARERSRLEDYPLFALRSALIVGLAMLGAMPLVRCDRLSLERNSGGSVAIALVVDDSLSMRATTEDGKSRFDRALVGAEQLLRSAREGDSVTLVLAGRPARIALSPTTDLDTARRTLSELVPSDRSTDLVSAVQLARTAIRGAPQKDHRVVVLSDLAADAIPEGVPSIDTPLPELARVADDCGITTADRRGTRVTASIACNTEAAARGRTLEVVVEKPMRGAPARPDGGAHDAVGDVVGHGDVSPRAGEQSIAMDVPAAGETLGVRLTGSDAVPHDDRAEVSDESSTRAVAVVADTVSAGAKTGGPTVVEQALAALGSAWVVRPLELVPEDENGYRGVGALVLDDPRGFSPEVRTALDKFLSRGGVALALIGPRGAETELSSPLEPFLHGALRWEPAENLGVDPASLAWLGAEGGSLTSLTRRGRARLDGTELGGARVLGRWTDSAPFLIERTVGRGLCVTVGLPASLDESDFAVRPGFLAILEHVLRQADQRSGSRRTLAGVAWSFSDAKHVSIEGEGGAVPVASERRDDACADGSERCEDTVLRAVPSLRGRYVVRVDDETEIRTVTLEPAEILAAPRAATPSRHTATTGPGSLVSASREVAMALAALLVAELALRIARRWAARLETKSAA